MTTTIVLKTHSWPVNVRTVDTYKPTANSDRVTTTDDEVPPDTEVMLHISSTRSMTFTELPIPDQIPAVEVSDGSDA